MKKYWKKMLLGSLLVILGIVVFVTAGDVITFEAIKSHSNALQLLVRDHYLLSVAIFGCAFFMTAFLVPGALVLTLTGGFLYGALPGAFFAAVFSTMGSTLAFLVSRHLLGRWLQQRYRSQLRRFNEEIARHGANYLFVLRVAPVMPSFLINYLSGMTHISAPRFALFSFLGISPGAIVYSLAGLQLQSIEAPADLLSARFLIGIWLLVLFALAPAGFDVARWLIRTRRLRKKRNGG